MKGGSKEGQKAKPAISAGLGSGALEPVVVRTGAGVKIKGDEISIGWHGKMVKIQHRLGS